MMLGTLVGSMVGFWCWFLLGFMGLPKPLIYVSGIWVIEPVLRYFDLYGQVILLFPALFVCLVSFSFYGAIIGFIVSQVVRVVDRY